MRIEIEGFERWLEEDEFQEGGSEDPRVRRDKFGSQLVAGSLSVAETTTTPTFVGS